jgi:hypothetical protein
MLLQLIVQHPEALGNVLKNTPVWVGGLFAALLALGLSQRRDRRAGLVRVTLMPVAMTVFSIWGTVSAFGASPHFAAVLLAWLVAAGVVTAAMARGRSPAVYDRATRSFALPGSWMPLLLILGIFLTKYVVGVELAMQPALAREAPFALTVGTLYGVFSGLFAARTWRLWRLVLQARPQQHTRLASA